MTRRQPILALLFWAINIGLHPILLQAGYSQDEDAAEAKPFFNRYCLECHSSNPDEGGMKGGITLQTLQVDLTSGKNLDQWETVLEVIKSGTMPPEDAPQPTLADRKRTAIWLQQKLRSLANEAAEPTIGSPTRRLTNFEYQNTLHDLTGVKLNVIDNLPQDPVKPYHFNNTAEFMLLGPEQIDRYLEVARRVMRSVIVDPEEPEVYKSRQQWDATETNKGFAKSLKKNEIAIHNSRRGTPGQGMSIKEFPTTGEFRIRFQGSAIFPNGAKELPLRFVMGYNLNINSSTQEVRPVGTVHLRNNPAQPRVYELTGRIENFPVQRGKMHKGKQRPDTLTLTPQNIYDDGTLNDENRFLYWPRQPDMPRAVVDWIEFEAPIVDAWPPEHHKRILFDSPLRENEPQKYIHMVLERFMSRAYRRPATKEEIDSFFKIYQILQDDLITMEATLRETLAMVLVTPQFLLHTKSDGDIISTDFELASKLSYFLWGSMPDNELYELAASENLDDDEVIAAQVRRLLDDPRSLLFVSNFTNQWLSLAKMKTVPINRDLFPRFLYYVEAGERAGTEKPYIPTIRDHMINETVKFVAELIWRNKSVANLVDSDFAMLNQPLAAHYGVDGVEGERIRAVPIEPKHHLGGLLTHGSILVGNSTGSAPHPIYRAVWLREAILGDHVRPPPADVPALSESANESAEKALNIKELLARHRTTESCNDCHSRLDPWGIPFERYNAIGKYQPFVPQEGTRVRGFDRKQDSDLIGYARYLKTVNTEPVSADSQVPHGPQVDGMAQLKKHLMTQRQHDIAENVVRRLLTYGIGRELNYKDRFHVETILAESEKDRFLLQDIIVRICQSGPFRGKTKE